MALDNASMDFAFVIATRARTSVQLACAQSRIGAAAKDAASCETAVSETGNTLAGSAPVSKAIAGAKSPFVQQPDRSVTRRPAE